MENLLTYIIRVILVVIADAVVAFVVVVNDIVVLCVLCI